MSSAMDSMFNPSRGGSGGGGSGGSVNVINNLNSSSPTDALSAGMGKKLNETIQVHEQLIAGVGANGDLGHVKVDGTTITIDSTTGVISSTGGSSNSVTYAQAILPTTTVDQVQWKIPFTDYKYPDDLLIVTQNSTVMDTDSYSITQNSDGVSWDVNIPNTSGFPLPIAKNNVFVIMIKGTNGGSGGGGSNVTVEDVLTSTSAINALSANMGRVLKNQLDTHELVKASELELGHVKVDDITIKSDANGIISVSDSVGKLNYSQGVLPTTIVDQQTWTIPFTDYVYPTDLLIVSQNTTFLSPDEYTVTPNADGIHWDLNIVNDSGFSLPINKNHVYVIVIKSAGTNSGGGSTFPQPAIKQFIAETLVDPLGGFHYKIASYIPQATDKFEINFNTTTLTSAMYTLSNDGVDTYIKLLVQESATQSKNNVAGTIYRNFDAF